MLKLVNRFAAPFNIIDPEFTSVITKKKIVMQNLLYEKSMSLINGLNGFAVSSARDLIFISRKYFLT
jgi:hypothetical protein